MKSWRAPLAVFLVALSMLVVFATGLYMKTSVFQVMIFFLSIDVALLAICFAQDDGRIRGAVPEEPKPCPNCGYYPGERTMDLVEPGEGK